MPKMSDKKKEAVTALVATTAVAPENMPTVPRHAYLTKGQRDALMAKFKRSFRSAPPNTRGHWLSISEVASRVLQEIQDLPEFTPALEAVQTLQKAIAAKYDVPLDAVDVSSSSITGLQLNYNTSDHYGDRDDVINRLRARQHREVNEEYAPRRESEAKAHEAWSIEREEKELVVKTAPTVETIMALVPECRVALPTPADRARMAEAGYTHGQMTTDEAPVTKPTPSVVLDV